MAENKENQKEALSQPSMEERIHSLERQLKASRASQSLTNLPEHGAGKGIDNIAETWSLYDQEQARAGK